MGNELAEIQRLIRDPNFTSSLLPLLVVSTLVFGGSLFFIIKLISLFRAPKLPAPTQSNHATTIREWVRYIFVPLPSKVPAAIGGGELDKLRALIEKLEEANALLRKQNANAMARIGELQGELKRLNDRHVEDGRLLELEQTRCQRLEQQIQKLDAKLQDAIRETERIFQQNADVIEPAKATPVSDILKDFPPPPKGKTE